MEDPLSSGDQHPVADILKEGIFQGKSASLTVISDSMAPLLRRGDLVSLQQFDGPEQSSGQIITFAYPHNPAEMITHRVAGTSQINGKTKIITWADRTLMFDRPIEVKDVIGRVIWRTRNDRILHLDRGYGAWLSDKLSKLAIRELKRITKLNINTDELGVVAITNSDKLRRKGKKIRRLRLLRRLNFLWATLLASTVDIISHLGTFGDSSP